MTRRVLSIIAIVVTALLLQSTVFAQLKLLGVRPELLYLVTIVIAILEGPQEGAVVGFAGGMAQDFMLNQPKGITALTLTLVGYAAGVAGRAVAARRTGSRVWPDSLAHPASVAVFGALVAASVRGHRAGTLTARGRPVGVRR